ncbi:hypothetical protein [Paenibacillus sp. VMFN-D1]|uniref:hypothetical protein n=1 Tax=Paenibacillus sp. VMFN-D1 TaxID=2135608 RepID=UPI000E26F8B6|nr:hypothetical protein [Paenibacillus sp. VMFN-D1]RED40518.1 hypothetical protein C7820_1678 [Paenibacillus sp. VMFN-D1]
MFNPLEVAELMVQHISTNFPDDVSLIGYYGSRAQGTATERSDLDFFFIPANADGFRHSLQFVVNGISFDFWPISWERAERIAAFEELNVSIIADCKLLYVRSEEDHERFLQLRSKIADQARTGLEWLHKAESRLKEAYIHLYNLSKMSSMDDLVSFRYEAQEILILNLESVSLINHTYYTKGWGKNREQIRNFPIQPETLEQTMETILNSSSGFQIREACERLTKDTLRLILQQKEKDVSGPDYPGRMKGFYEEVKGIMDKVVSACESSDYHTAYFWAVGVQKEVSRFLFFTEKGYWPSLLCAGEEELTLYKELGFPDLIGLLNQEEFSPLKEAVEQLDSQLEQHLQSRGVQINRFRNAEEFSDFLLTLR